MKQPLLITIATLVSLPLYSQLVIDFGKFPGRQSDTLPYATSEVLAKLNWRAIEQYADTAEGHRAAIFTDSMLTSYHYSTQYEKITFELVSYNGLVLEYTSDATNSSQPSTSSFFDKRVWLQYVHAMLPALADNLKLTLAENKAVLKAYYQLLGVDTDDEYGWICEYGMAGLPTQRRVAVLVLLEQHRIDLLRKLLPYPNLQTRLYAIDALIYNDVLRKAEIDSAQKQLKKLQQQEDRFRRQPKVDNDYIYFKNTLPRREIEQNIRKWKTELLTRQEWEMVRTLRDSKQTVRTCGNAGSYKIYGTPIAEVLSDKAIAEISKNYEVLK